MFDLLVQPQKNVILGQRIVDELGKYQDGIKRYGSVKKEVEKQQEQYKHISAMNDSTSVQMISDNYNYLAFTDDVFNMHFHEYLNV